MKTFLIYEKENEIKSKPFHSRRSVMSPDVPAPPATKYHSRKLLRARPSFNKKRGKRAREHILAGKSVRHAVVAVLSRLNCAAPVSAADH